MTLPVTLTEAITRANTRTLSSPHCSICGTPGITHEGITLNGDQLVTFNTCSSPDCTGIRRRTPNTITRATNGDTP